MVKGGGNLNCNWRWWRRYLLQWKEETPTTQWKEETPTIVEGIGDTYSSGRRRRHQLQWKWGVWGTDDSTMQPAMLGLLVTLLWGLRNPQSPTEGTKSPSIAACSSLFGNGEKDRLLYRGTKRQSTVERGGDINHHIRGQQHKLLQKGVETQITMVNIYDLSCSLLAVPAPSSILYVKLVFKVYEKVVWAN